MPETLFLPRDTINAAIAEKAWKDEAFHKEVLANPNKLFEAHLGQAVPAGVTIKVLEDTPSTFHIVLPAKPANASELSDAELENVAGGATPLAGAAVTAITFIGSFAIKAALHGTNAKW